MPTVNPRINVTLSPSTDALVARLAGLQRVSKSQVLRELLEAAEPALQRAVALMEAASRAHGDVLSGLASSLDRAQEEAERSLQRNLAASDDLVRQAESIAERRPRGARAPRGGAGDRVGSAPRAPKDPPSSNRGVKSPTRGQK
jgi:uncharacterized protein (DUF1778 family)